MSKQSQPPCEIHYGKATNCEHGRHSRVQGMCSQQLSVQNTHTVQQRCGIFLWFKIVNMHTHHTHKHTSALDYWVHCGSPVCIHRSMAMFGVTFTVSSQYGAEDQAQGYGCAGNHLRSTPTSPESPPARQHKLLRKHCPLLQCKRKLASSIDCSPQHLVCPFDSGRK